jgi:DNA polymerase III alpha subunit
MDTTNRLNRFSESIVDTGYALNLLYNGKKISGEVTDLNEVTLYNENAESIFYDDRKLQIFDHSISAIAYHNSRTNVWNIPEKYLQIDVDEFILSKCNTQAEKDRVNYELALYLEYDLYNILRLMIYIVDTLTENNVTWGVGRGSSVSSYCLYLIGIHRINSMKYNLDIKEFLK